MAFSPVNGRRYDMPALFGPSAIPDETIVEDAQAIILSAQISKRAADALLPGHFTSPETPVLSLAYVQYDKVDYLGGRGYNEIVVTVSAVHRADENEIVAAYAPVLWVNKVGALISGREYMGLPKLLGTIPERVEFEGGFGFSCYEEEVLLINGRAIDMKPLDAAALDRVNSRAREVRTFGWKFIPGPDGRHDLDYPLINVMRWEYHTAASGRGELTFGQPGSRDAPFSASAIAALRSLEMDGELRAFYGRGKATIDRKSTRRLDKTA